MVEHSPFDLAGRVVVITGGAGLLGRHHAVAVARAGGYPVLADIDRTRAEAVAVEVSKRFNVPACGLACDVTRPDEIETARDAVLEKYGRLDGLINNAANNPQVDDESGNAAFARLESSSLEAWNADIAVGLTGAFLCSRIFGQEMARRGGGVILNIASDLSVIAPDQRLYRVRNRPSDQQPTKPASYSVIKSGLVGLTRYVATYWADRKVRCNALSPGGIYVDQPNEFVELLVDRIPLARMAEPDDYEGAVVFLLSDASRYMTGQNVVIDGGRSVW